MVLLVSSVATEPRGLRGFVYVMLAPGVMGTALRIGGRGRACLVGVDPTFLIHLPPANGTPVLVLRDRHSAFHADSDSLPGRLALAQQPFQQ